MIYFKIKNSEIRNNIFIPKYYDPQLAEELKVLSETHDILKIGDLINEGVLSVITGDEIGKMAYGTGNIPFVRTSDITNWEIKTVPKQGVSEEIYSFYNLNEDIKVGDILFVRDGTYLIGTNCMITEIDIPMLFQSHILKFRLLREDVLNKYLFFLSLNCSLVQKQIRNMQFTADIIDTLGNRFKEIYIPIPKDLDKCKYLANEAEKIINIRVKYKIAIKQLPILIEQIIETQNIDVFESFYQKETEELLNELVQDTTTLEFGEFSAFSMNIAKIKNNIFLPKYYNPLIKKQLKKLSENCEVKSIQELLDEKIIDIRTGDEIGKMAYGTGSIPFVRTSDFSNLEIKANTKQGISDEIYQLYKTSQDVNVGDILIVRDGTYLIGTSCIITENDANMLYCGGLIKIRVLDKTILNEYLLLGLLNSYIVKRQIRTKQFTRDVIDTLGQRLSEVFIPIPKNELVRNEITLNIKKIILNRVTGREKITQLTEEFLY